MKKIILSLALTLSLIGNSCATTEENMQTGFSKVVAESRKKISASSKGKKIAVAAAFGALCSGLSTCGRIEALAQSMPYIDPRELYPEGNSSTLALSLAIGAASFLGYEKVRQKIANNHFSLAEQIIAHYATHADEIPAEHADIIAPLVTHYTEHKALSRNEQTDALITLISNDAPQASFRQLWRTAALGAGVALLTQCISFAEIACTEGKRTHLDSLWRTLVPTITTSCCGAAFFALYEAFKQRQESKA